MDIQIIDLLHSKNVNIVDGYDRIVWRGILSRAGIFILSFSIISSLLYLFSGYENKLFYGLMAPFYIADTYILAIGGSYWLGSFHPVVRHIRK
jgi:hypothetical protein